MTTCVYCGKDTGTRYLNYCNSQCGIAEAEANGGPVICPNNLPVTCIRAYDSAMLEHEHADHPNYKFPVMVDYVGNDPESFARMLGPNGEEYLDNTNAENMRHECHALIYTDGIIAVTLYECCYAMWTVKDGKLVGGHLWEKGEWLLCEAARNRCTTRGCFSKVKLKKSCGKKLFSKPYP